MPRIELEDEALQVFVESILEIDVTLTGVCSHLCQEVSSRARSAAREYLRGIKTTTRLAFESSAPQAQHGHVDLVLAKAVTDRIISKFEAHIIGSTRIDKVDLNSLASEIQMARSDLHLARKVAEHRLLEWLQH
jgi:hypothetical protein